MRLIHIVSEKNSHQSHYQIMSSKWRIVNKSNESDSVEKNEGIPLVVRHIPESNNSNFLWSTAGLESQTEGGVEETSNYPFEIQQTDTTSRQMLSRYEWGICVGFTLIVVMFVTFVVLLVIHDHRRVHS